MNKGNVFTTVFIFWTLDEKKGNVFKTVLSSRDLIEKGNAFTTVFIFWSLDNSG